MRTNTPGVEFLSAEPQDVANACDAAWQWLCQQKTHPPFEEARIALMFKVDPVVLTVQNGAFLWLYGVAGEVEVNPNSPVHSAIFGLAHLRDAAKREVHYGRTARRWLPCPPDCPECADVERSHPFPHEAQLLPAPLAAAAAAPGGNVASYRCPSCGMELLPQFRLGDRCVFCAEVAS